MKVCEVLREQNDSTTQDYRDMMQTLVGKTIEWDGNSYKIKSVKWRKNYGQNYDIEFAKMPSHPYGEMAFTKRISNLLGGLKVEFSESGMQGPSYINVDVYRPKVKPPTDVKKGLDSMLEFALSRGWEKVKDAHGGYLIERPRKGTLLLSYEPETEDDEEQFVITKRYAANYWDKLVATPDIEHMLDQMNTGYLRMYFLAPKPEKVQKPHEVGSTEKVEGDKNYNELKDRYPVKAFKNGKLEFTMEEGLILIVYNNGYVRLKTDTADRLRMLRQPPRTSKRITSMFDMDTEEGRALQAKVDKRMGIDNVEHELFKALEFANTWSKKYLKGKYAAGNKK